MFRFSRDQGARRTSSALAALGLLVWLSSAEPAAAFPGVLITSTPLPVALGTTHLVVLQHGGVSVVTIMVDYRGPIERFLLILPVPDDVTLARVRTVKHEFIGRLEEVTAPRLVEFWEKDPCAPGPAEQAWQERIPVSNRGFLTPEILPPPDPHYPVSNELSVPSKPQFKGQESEFRYHVLRQTTLTGLNAWLERRGYPVAGGVAETLRQLASRKPTLLLAEVDVKHVELVAQDHLQLGGIRYWTKQPLPPVPSTLGLQQQQGSQDIFIYTLHKERRFEVQNYKNRFAPTNLSVEPELGARLGVLYNAIFDLQVKKQGPGFVTEYVGPSDACGEPCPNAPLELRELLTLGGDVVEAELPASASAAPSEALETSDEQQKFEATLDALSPEERRVTRHEHQVYLEALAKRRALVARQTYVVTRLHHRYRPTELPRDIELGPAPSAVRGGYGIPRGPSATLDQALHEAQANTFQVRFAASHAWQGSIPCRAPLRWRWGKRWSSESQAWRKVHAARDLPRLGRDPQLLETALVGGITSLGLSPKAAPRILAPRAVPKDAATENGCGVPARASGRQGTAWLYLLLLAISAGRVRIRGRSKSKDAEHQ